MAGSTDTLERETKLQGLGSSRLRKEDARFIRGKGTYVDDIKLPGMLFGAIVRSPYAHARIKSINKAKALAVPGVVAVLTADDLKPVKLALDADDRRRRPGRAGGQESLLPDAGGRDGDRQRSLQRRGWSGRGGSRIRGAARNRRSAPIHGSRRPDHSRRHRRQGRSRSRQAHPPQSHLHLGSGRQGRARMRSSPAPP